MKPTPNYPDIAPILVFGAHPDDIEFGCGAIIARETQAGRKAHFIVCSRGEAATNGTPELREAEATKAAHLLGATIEFIDLGGDAHFEISAAHTIKLAEIIRRIRPSTVLATTPQENQHPDHSRLGKLVRDAARLARYGGLTELRQIQAHEIEQLFFYAVTPEAEAKDMTPILIDVSAPQVVAAWTEAMTSHRSQAPSRPYVEMQISRARLLGARAGVEYAMALFPNEPHLFQSLKGAGKGARRF